MYKFLGEINNVIEEMFSTRNFKESSITMYRGRINKFFEQYMSLPINENKPIDAITYFDINTYLTQLKCEDSERVNHYNSLKLLFEYTYLKGLSKEIISNVERPKYERKPKDILSSDSYGKLRRFIYNRENDIYDRLMLGLFLFTGLSRQYIFGIKNNDFVLADGAYKLRVWKNDGEICLPLKAELQLLISEYILGLSKEKILDRFCKVEENYLSTYISNLCKKILGKKCSPGILSSTFISKALSSENHVWEVSRLTLESITTIEKYIIYKEEQLTNKQTSILNSF